MSAIIIVGAQWGDEGKGKATDILGGKVDYVVKPNGGNNAGHTVVVGGEKYELKLLPAGVLSENATPILGNGVVVNLEALFEEIDGLEARGANASRLKVSANAHLVAPYHQQLDRVQERFLGKRAIGTTGRGIGPTYADKVARVGLRVQDVFDESILRQKIESALDVKNQMLVKMYNRRAISVDETMDYFGRYAERLAPMVVDAERVLNDALSRGEHVLMEGGQATMLDVDHGTYPFVTSSNPTAGGACVGSGIGEIPICVAYDVDGKRFDEMPLTQTDFHHAEPIYETMPAWDEDITECRTFEDLPQKAQDYVLRLEELSGAPISYIGVGPGRDQTIVRNDVMQR